MKQMTNYPSIDKTHEKGMKPLVKNPIIPSISIYNALKKLTKKYQNEYDIGIASVRERGWT